MTSSYRASSRITSEFYSSYFNSSKFFKKLIYTSYNSSEFFYSQSAFFILKKSSSFSNSSKSISFAFAFVCHFLNRNSSYKRISLINHWSYQYFITSKMINVDLHMIENSRLDKRNRQIVDCKLCQFVVFVNKWQYTDFFEAHVNACSNCFFNQNVIYSRMKETRTKKIRFAKQQVRTEKKRAERLLHHQIEKTRLIKKRAKQQQIEQTRIAKKQKKIRLTTFACRRCNAKFSSNTKFHHHIEDHHQKKSAKLATFTSIATFASITFLFTSKAKLVKITTIAKHTSKTMIAMSTSFAIFFSSSESALLLTSFVNHSKSTLDISFSLTSFVTSKQSFIASIATSKKQIFWVEIVSRSVIASKLSRLSVFTSKILSKALKIETIICSSISSSIFSTSQSKHQKFYLTIENLFEMFAEKRIKSDLVRIKKSKSFSKLFNQIRITFYFKFAINQSKSIIQNSKISNSKSFQQHTFAKSNRVKFISFTRNKWFEKSIILSYEISIFFRSSVSEITSILSYKMLVISRFNSKIEIVKISIKSSIIRVFLNISDFRHVCRICNDIFEFNNDLHRHLRAIHFDHAFRHEFEKHRALERNVMTRRFLICWRRNVFVFLLLFMYY